MLVDKKIDAAVYANTRVGRGKRCVGAQELLLLSVKIMKTLEITIAVRSRTKQYFYVLHYIVFCSHKNCSLQVKNYAFMWRL